MEQSQRLDLIETIDRLKEENRQLREAMRKSENGKTLLDQEEEFSRLLTVSKRIVSELEVPKVLELVADNARKFVDADLVLLPLLNEHRDRYTYAAASGEDAALVYGTSHDVSVGMCGWVLKNERSLLFGETSPNWLEEKTPWEAGQQSAVLVPLFGRDGIIGGLSALGKKGGGAFTRHDLDLLTMFANQVSTAIANAFFFQQLQQSEQGLIAVNECFLSFGVDPLANLKSITRTTGKILNSTCVLYNRKEGDLVHTLVGWHLPVDLPLTDMGTSRLFQDTIEQSGDEPLIVRNLRESAYAESDPDIIKLGIRLCVSYSVRSANQSPIGSLCAMFKDEIEFSSYQLSLLRVLGRAAAVEEERFRAEIALRSSETRFRTIIENTSVGILAAEIETGQFHYVNPVVCQMLGYQKSELLALDFRAIHPAEELSRIEKAFAQREGIQSRCLRRDRSQFSVDIKSVMMELDGVQCLVGFFSDITDRRLLEAERLKTQKLEAVGKLAGGVAHDFNNLLQAIFGYISMAKVSMDNKQKACVMLEQAESSLQQSVSLTNQLLTFSRGGKPVKKRVALQKLIENSTKFMLSGSSSKYKVIVPSDLWLAEVDTGQISQVIQNIVLNADQAMSVGGSIVVKASNVAGDQTMLPPGLAPGNYVMISIQDCGCGIPEEHIAKIFDPYFTTKEKGSGLGLATAYSIVRNHGGTITVTTQLGGGSIFWIFLPASAEVSPPKPAGSIKQPIPTEKKLRILVMDDDSTLLELSRQFLTLLGHEVKVSAHGQEALDIYSEAMTSGVPFDMVILDLTIRGGMGGKETLRNLLAIDPAVKAIVSSGYSDDASMAVYRSLGFKACLMKPYSLNDLKSTLSSMTE